jgi:hypothetical protein
MSISVKIHGRLLQNILQISLQPFLPARHLLALSGNVRFGEAAQFLHRIEIPGTL